MSIVDIDGHSLSITKNYHKNTYIGKFIHDNSIPEIYGDTENEVIEQAEDLINNN